MSDKEFRVDILEDKDGSTSVGLSEIGNEEASVQYNNVYHFTCIDKDGEVKWEETVKNLIPTEGLNHILGVVLNDQVKVSTWYIGLYSGNYTPQADDTAANIVSRATEYITYDEATRQAYVESVPAAGSTNNLASRATFTIATAGAGTLYGAFMSSASAKSATTGTLFCATKFSASRTVVATDQILVGYTVSATSV